jgi:hypothetical protein
MRLDEQAVNYLLWKDDKIKSIKLKFFSILCGNTIITLIMAPKQSSSGKIRLYLWVGIAPLEQLFIFYNDICPAGANYPG